MNYMNKKKDKELLLLTLEMLKNNPHLRENISTNLLQRTFSGLEIPNMRVTTVKRVIASLEELKIIAYIPTEDTVPFKWTFVATDEYLDEVIEKIKEAE